MPLRGRAGGVGIQDCVDKIDLDVISSGISLCVGSMITSEKGIHNLWLVAKSESNHHKDDTSLETDTHRVVLGLGTSLSRDQLVIGFHMHTIWTNSSFNYLVIVATHGGG